MITGGCSIPIFISTVWRVHKLIPVLLVKKISILIIFFIYIVIYIKIKLWP
jgi:hypothetical protein